MTFWHGKKVFITGHTGFKGSWLSWWLQSLGAELSGYALPPATEPNLFTLLGLDKSMNNTLADVRDANALQHAVSTFKPDIVFHLAAQPLVRYSYDHPVETYATNVMGTVHLLEAVKACASVRCVVNITTDKCYDNKEWCWGYRENDRLGGYDPYSNSKACAELVTSAYRDSYFRQMKVGLATARAGNVIGGGDWACDRLIPDIIRACMNQQPVQIRNPQALRPWQHVLEPLSGYMLLAENLYAEPTVYSEAWNFGPDDHDVKPVGWIADYITQQWSSNSQWLPDAGKHPHEATYLKLDCSKVKSRLGWQPRLSLPANLALTIAWYKAFQSGEDMRSFTQEQIQQFLHINEKREGNHDKAAIY